MKMLCVGHWTHNRPVTIQTIIVSDAFIPDQDGLQCHPDLLLWQQQLIRRKRSWFQCNDKNPLAWYAALTGSAPALQLAHAAASLPAATTQLWVASPYHAQLMRESVRVMPESDLAWGEADAARLCGLLNPLLAEEGMQLVQVGAALLFCCEQSMDAWPESFAAIAGNLLPDCHHQGEDGGRLNRLLSELQMLLFQHPSIERHEHNQPDINGIWLWGPTAWPDGTTARQLPVATRDPFLHSIADGRDATLMITAAAQLAELMQTDIPLPKRVILAGGDHAALLTRSWLPWFPRAGWTPKSAKPEQQLLALLRH